VASGVGSIEEGAKNNVGEMDSGAVESPLRKQAWDYFAIHASQRMTIFNFYIVLSSVVATSYFASFKSDSNLQSARWLLASLLVFFAFIFWKLDERNKTLIKNAERALKYFEEADTSAAQVAKVFAQEEAETAAKRASGEGFRRVFFWRLHLSYSECFNSVYVAFLLVGIGGLIEAFSEHLQWSEWYLSARRMLGWG
jgi:uncharacterized membrane protein